MQPNIFVVVNCCIIALSVSCFNSLTWSANSLYSLFSAMTHKKKRSVDVEKYAYYVKKLYQSIGLEI